MLICHRHNHLAKFRAIKAIEVNHIHIRHRNSHTQVELMVPTIKAIMATIKARTVKDHRSTSHRLQGICLNLFQIDKTGGIVSTITCSGRTALRVSKESRVNMSIIRVERSEVIARPHLLLPRRLRVVSDRLSTQDSRRTIRSQLMVYSNIVISTSVVVERGEIWPAMPGRSTQTLSVQSVQLLWHKDHHHGNKPEAACHSRRGNQLEVACHSHRGNKQVEVEASGYQESSRKAEVSNSKVSDVRFLSRYLFFPLRHCWSLIM